MDATVVLPGLLSPPLVARVLAGGVGGGRIPEVEQLLFAAHQRNPWGRVVREPLPYVVRCYRDGERMREHVDVGPDGNAVATSMTVMLADNYQGGQLWIGNQPGPVLRPGDGVLFPGDTLHRVELVTGGERWALVQWAV